MIYFERFLDPKNALTFTRLFRTEKNKGVLLAFLNDIFAGVHPKIEEVIFQPLPRDHEVPVLAQSLVNVSCRDSDGKQYIVEMLCAENPSLLNCVFYYASRAYVNQMILEQSFNNLKSVVFLIIFKGQLFPQKQECLSHHRICDVCTGKCDIKGLTLSFLELGKINKSFEECQNRIEKWVYFLKCFHKSTSEKLEIIARDYPPIREAYHAIERYNYAKEDMEAYYYYDMNADSIATIISDAKKEGLAEGEAKKAREMVLRLHQQGVDKNIIATAAHLSLEEVEQMLAEGDTARD